MNVPKRGHPLSLIVRGSAVGMFATVADLFALVLFVSAGVPPALASFPALAVGVAVQFFGSKFFTFEDRSRVLSTDGARQGALFLAVEALALGLNLVLFDIGLELTHIPYPVLRLATTSFVYFGFSLPLWSLVFRKRAS